MRNMINAEMANKLLEGSNAVDFNEKINEMLENEYLEQAKSKILIELLISIKCHKSSFDLEIQSDYNDQLIKWLEDNGFKVTSTEIPFEIYTTKLTVEFDDIKTNDGTEWNLDIY